MTDQPKYVGMLPWMTEWWFAHVADDPVVVIRCGHRPPQGQEGKWCNNAIGQVKAADGQVLAMRHNEYPESGISWTPPAAEMVDELAPETAAELAAAVDGLLANVLKHLGQGEAVEKRRSWPRDVAPIENLDCYVCRIHGEIAVDCARLAEVVKDTVAAGRTKQTYWAVD